MDEKILEAIGAFIYERVKYAKLTTDDAWFHDKELLNLYLQLHILEELRIIGANLDDIHETLQKLGKP